MLTSAQLTIWQHKELRDVRRHDELNGLGPYELFTTENICRHFDCANYDGCLTFAAANRWASFSCEGCRKAAHGKFLLEDGEA